MAIGEECVDGMVEVAVGGGGLAIVKGVKAGLETPVAQMKLWVSAAVKEGDDNVVQRVAVV